MIRSAYPEINLFKQEYQKGSEAYVVVQSLKARTEKWVEIHNGHPYSFGSEYSGLETVSKKTLDDLGLTLHVGQVINTQHEVYDTLRALPQ